MTPRTDPRRRRVAAGPPAEAGAVSIEIPAVGVDAPVVPVGLLADRTMEVPAVDQAGWYEPGPRPGEAGPAVIVGHVDSRRGPAVFFWLQELRPGDRIVVGLDGERPGRSWSSGSSAGPRRTCRSGASGAASTGRSCA
jgi:hypothetical protein